jgi:hypothetical protein
MDVAGTANNAGVIVVVGALLASLSAGRHTGGEQH